MHRVSSLHRDFGIAASFTLKRITNPAPLFAQVITSKNALLLK